jgi:tetratricopeptide (TPR) repeat protein
MSAASKTSETRIPTLRLTVIVFAVTMGLWALDVFLARAEHSEIQAEAQRFYVRGTQMLHAGKTAQATDLLRRAHSMARGNRQYELGLIEALTAAGKPDEAETNLQHALQRNPNDGPVNLLAARLMVKTRRITDAEAYYHRAIYGSWPDASDAHRIETRMELIRLLAARGDEKSLLAELLPLQSEVQNDIQKRTQIAQLYLQAGSPNRAADVYRDLIREGHADEAAYAGLGEAELQMGRYRSAQSAFLSAFRRNPADTSIRGRMELAAMMAGLDPTIRQLGAAEKYARSSHVLERARDALNRCIAGRAASGRARDLLTKADEVIAARRPRTITNEAAEERLTLAEELWKARVAECGPRTSAEEEPLKLIMQTLAQ